MGASSYKVVQGLSQEEVSTLVEYNLQAGFELVGGISVAPYKPGIFLYAQAMVYHMMDGEEYESD